MPSFFSHSETSSFWISGQMNFVYQGQPSFSSPYQGPHSLLPGSETAFGLAGYSNLDVVRNPVLGATPYVARGMFHAVFALDSERSSADRNPLSLFTSLPTRRLEFRLGRFQFADFFDNNSAGQSRSVRFFFVLSTMLVQVGN